MSNINSSFLRDRLLTDIVRKPGMTIRAFTHGNHVPDSHGERFAADLERGGLIAQREGKLYPTDAGIAWLTRPAVVAEPRTWCAVSTGNEPWQPKPWVPVRAGADDNLNYHSLSGAKRAGER